MNLDKGQVLHASQFARVVYHEGRSQPAAVWLRESGEWKVARFYADAGDALAHAYRAEGTEHAPWCETCEKTVTFDHEHCRMCGLPGRRGGDCPACRPSHHPGSSTWIPTAKTRERVA